MFAWTEDALSQLREAGCRAQVWHHSKHRVAGG